MKKFLLLVCIVSATTMYAAPAGVSDKSPPGKCMVATPTAMVPVAVVFESNAQDAFAHLNHTAVVKADANHPAAAQAAPGTAFAPLYKQ